MNMQLISGHFNPADGLELITQMVHAKIKFHERKIDNASTEEDIKMRESKIKRLQKELYEAKEYLAQVKGNIIIQSEINLST